MPSLQTMIPSLRRKKGVNARSKKRGKSRVGKLGIVRLAGEDLAALRIECFQRDGWMCRECGCEVAFRSTFMVPKAEMAHIHAKRNGGDVLENVRTLCPDCHRKEHAYGKSMKKPCPRRERA